MKIEIHNMYKKYQVDYFRSKQIFSDYSLKLDSEKINFFFCSQRNKRYAIR